MHALPVKNLNIIAQLSRIHRGSMKPYFHRRALTQTLWCCPSVQALTLTPMLQVSGHRHTFHTMYTGDPDTQLLLYGFGEEEGEDTKKKRLPNPVTVPERGPLQLKTSRRLNVGSQTPLSLYGRVHTSSAKHRTYTNPTHYQRPKRSLTRFPVPMVQRPLDCIERELGEMSCADLIENIHQMSDLQSHGGRPGKLPYLHPMMKYSPMHQGGYGDGPIQQTTERFTLSEEGPMDISITYSRHMATATVAEYRTSFRPPSHTHTRAYTHPLSVSSAMVHRPLSVREHKMLATTRDSRRETMGSAVAASGDSQVSPRPVSLQRQYISGTIRPTIAPHSVRAAALHRLKPITASTMLRGRRISSIH